MNETTLPVFPAGGWRTRHPMRSTRHRTPQNSVIASDVQLFHQYIMVANSGPASLSEETKQSSMGKRLIVAAILIGLAIGGLALVDELRSRPKFLLAPH